MRNGGWGTEKNPQKYEFHRTSTPHYFILPTIQRRLILALSVQIIKFSRGRFSSSVPTAFLQNISKFWCVIALETRFSSGRRGRCGQSRGYSKGVGYRDPFLTLVHRPSPRSTSTLFPTYDRKNEDIFG